MTDDIGVAGAQDFRDSPVDSSQCPIERDRQRYIIDGVDQFFEIALRARNHLSELIQLLVRGHDPGAVLQISKETLQFADFAFPARGIYRKQYREEKQAGWNRPKPVG